ncbi:MAG TPA: VTT domain-containing protein [Pyrinomonadaceae bacterium]|nr:VTT domain-containing protein [Pyrinomonadaceae bacterium]
MAKQESATKVGALWLGLVLGGTILLVTLVAYSETFQNLVKAVTDWASNIIEVNPTAGAVVFFLFSAISAMLAFASSTVLVPAANLVWGKPISFLLLWGGWVAGAFAAYGIGRVARPLLVRIGYKEKLAEYEQFVSKRMKFWAVLLFCFAVPSEIPGYVFGGLHYPLLKFITAMAIAEAVYALGVVIAGESLLTAQPLPLLATVGIMILILVVATLALRKIKKRKSKSE